MVSHYTSHHVASIQGSTKHGTEEKRLTRSRKRRRCIRSSSLFSASPRYVRSRAAEVASEPDCRLFVVLRVCVCVCGEKKNHQFRILGPGACLGRSVSGSHLFSSSSTARITWRRTKDSHPMYFILTKVMKGDDVEDSISHCNNHETHSSSQKAGVFTYFLFSP